MQTTLVVHEWWRGRLWSAVPHLLVTVDDGYLTYVPAGTAGTYASSIGVPGRSRLPRAERKLLALETCVYRVVERRAAYSTLNFFTPGSHARISLSWTPEGRFAGWYVNFEVPVTWALGGLRTLDLVADLLIRPDGGWEWKDRDDFDDAVRRGLLDGRLLETFEAEAERILGDAAAGAGPFSTAWRTWRPDPAWARPKLPARFQVGGAAWSG